MYDGVTAMLQSEDFQRPIKQFVDTNCLIFSEEVRSALRERFVVSDRDPVQDENHHEHTKVHAQFCELLEDFHVFLHKLCALPVIVNSGLTGYVGLVDIVGLVVIAMTPLI